MCVLVEYVILSILVAFNCEVCVGVCMYVGANRRTYFNTLWYWSNDGEGNPSFAVIKAEDENNTPVFPQDRKLTLEPCCVKGGRYNNTYKANGYRLAFFQCDDVFNGTYRIIPCLSHLTRCSKYTMDPQCKQNITRDISQFHSCPHCS